MQVRPRMFENNQYDNKKRGSEQCSGLLQLLQLRGI
jgi:hypothetical protein